MTEPVRAEPAAAVQRFLRPGTLQLGALPGTDQMTTLRTALREQVPVILGSLNFFEDKLHLKRGVRPQEILRELVAKDIQLAQFELSMPTLDEIFIRVVQGEGEAA